MAVTRILPDPDNPDQMAEAVVVKVTDAQEPFGHITLEDGTYISLRTVVLEVARFKDRWDKSGNPIYNITSQGSMSITVPPELRKKTHETNN